MSTQQKLVDKAVSYIGENYKHFCNSFWGGCFAWCAAFVSVVCKEAGVEAPWSTSCNAQIREWKKMGCYRTDRNIQIGDIVYYNWDSVDDADHVGICTSISSDGTLRITEGNFGNYPNDQTKVTHRYIKPTYRYIYGYARPKFSSSSTSNTTTSTPQTAKEKIVQVNVKQLSNGSVGTAVKAMQVLLVENGCSVGRYGCDGEVGPDTVNAIKEFQKTRGLTVDGICGVKTWTELLK